MSISKVRVYELSRELDVENKDVMAACEQLNILVKSHSSTITESEASSVRQALQERRPLRDSEELAKDSPESKEKAARQQILAVSAVSTPPLRVLTPPPEPTPPKDAPREPKKDIKAPSTLLTSPTSPPSPLKLRNKPAVPEEPKAPSPQPQLTPVSLTPVSPPPETRLSPKPLEIKRPAPMAPARTTRQDPTQDLPRGSPPRQASNPSKASAARGENRGETGS
ncbi:MAG: hypothetical protein HC919_13080 [Oscillatoriales cyanobacterium SM2_2_1]|nr:hypothetical protein [Oscillatoriales cyanobacterium SM2_2_1]